MLAAGRGRRLFLRVVAGSLLASLAAPLAGVASYILAAKRGAALPGAAPAVAEGRGLVCLPPPRLDGGMAVEEALARRRSIREYTGEPLELWELGQLLWAAYGVTETRHGFKTTPSAGATYPLEVYVVVFPQGVRAGEGGFLEPGSYHYDPHTHCMRLVRRGDFREELYRAAVEQEWVRRAAANLVLAAVFERTTRVYGERGVRYVWIEVGHAGQNVYLQATSLGLATVAIGAFFDDWVREIIGAPAQHRPAYIMPLARPAWTHSVSLGELLDYYQRHGRRG